VEPKDKWTQPPLTPEAANPPEKPPAKKGGTKYVVPDVILPAEDKPLLPRDEARKQRREDYLKNGS
jgi:hypothetical protein